MKNRKYIEISASKKKWLREVFRCSDVTIWSALTYGTNSDQAKKIRRIAMSNGGVMMRISEAADGFMPDCQLDFERDAAGVQKVIQTFSNGIRVVFDATSSTAVMYINDEPQMNYQRVDTRRWAEVAFEAQLLSQSLNA